MTPTVGSRMLDFPREDYEEALRGDCRVGL